MYKTDFQRAVYLKKNSQIQLPNTSYNKEYVKLKIGQIKLMQSLSYLKSSCGVLSGGTFAFWRQK